MKKTCKTLGSDGKGNGRALKVDVVGEALKDYLGGKNREAWTFAYNLCRDADEAGELVQEACYRVLRESRRYDPSKPVKSWLFTILRNAFTDSRRRTERKAGLSLDFNEEGRRSYLHETLAANEPSILEALEREETAARVRMALRMIGADERRVLTLCDGDRRRYDDVARVLRIPTGTVRSRLFRARRKLRSHAERLGLA
jgi:RNA polymerase sigma-70 factor (ECF subfamily)